MVNKGCLGLDRCQMSQIAKCYIDVHQLAKCYINSDLDCSKKFGGQISTYIHVEQMMFGVHSFSNCRTSQVAKCCMDVHQVAKFENAT